MDLLYLISSRLWEISKQVVVGLQLSEECARWNEKGSVWKCIAKEKSFKETHVRSACAWVWEWGYWTEL